MLRKVEAVRNALCAYAADADVDVERVFATSRRTEVACRMHAGESDHFTAHVRIHAEAEAAQKLVLGRFHVPEECREMHDPGHVGVAELDKPRGMEGSGHGEG